MNQWFKIWAVGNGGQRCYEEYVFWLVGDKPDKEDMAYRIEEKLGPLPGSIRSLNWEPCTPPPEVVAERIQTLRSQRRYALAEIRIHQGKNRKA